MEVTNLTIYIIFIFSVIIVFMYLSINTVYKNPSYDIDYFNIKLENDLKKMKIDYCSFNQC